MVAVRRNSLFGLRRLVCVALIAATASVSSAYKPDSDAKAAYDRAIAFRASLDYRSARVELMNATAQDGRWGQAFVAQAEVARAFGRRSGGLHRCRGPREKIAAQVDRLHR